MASMTISLAAVLLSLALCANAFFPNDLIDILASTLEFEKPNSTTHRDMSRDAILQATRTLFLDNENPDHDSTAAINDLGNNFNEDSLLEAYFGNRNSDRTRRYEDAIDEVLDANVDTDLGPEVEIGAAHFDGEQIVAGQERLTYLRRLMLGEIAVGHYDEARRFLGRMFHTLQDFYSHSNWIEMGEQDPHPAIGTPGMIPNNLSPLDQPTCSNCPVESEIGIALETILDIAYDEHAENIYDCQDNILSSINEAGILTTGYYGGDLDANGNRIPKPCGKCSHGGVADAFSDVPARGGINKDGLSNLFAAHPHLHLVAAEVATKATVKFLESIRSEIDDDFRYAALFNIELPGNNVEELVTSIAYVIDTTQSMGDVLPMIQSALPQIKAELTAYMQDLGEGSTFRYILVPYNDPDPGVVSVTQNISVFIDAIGSLTAGGTSDCNEPTFGALVRALEQSLPRSSVYVFTDAPANDDYRLAQAQALITEKDIEVNFIVTPGCNMLQRKRQSSDYDMYRYIATFSGGQMLTVPNSDVADLAILVTTSARRTHTSLCLPVAGSGSFSDDIAFNIDASVQEVIIIANGGGSLTANLFTPSGSSADTLPEFSVDLMSGNTYIVTLNTSMLSLHGQWVLQMEATGAYDARVIGLVDIDFEYNAFRPDAASHFAYSVITSQPVVDENIMFVIQAVVMGGFSGVTFFSANLWRFDPDSSDEEFNLETTDGMEFSGEVEKPSVGSYRLQVFADNPALSRVSSRGIHVTDVDLSLNGMQKDFLTLFRGQESTIALVLRNLGQEVLLDLSTLQSDASVLGFSFSVSPQSVSLGEGESIDVTVTVIAPEDIVGDTTASVRLTVIATSTTDVLRNDFVMIDVFASNTEPPVIQNVNYPICSGSPIPACFSALWLLVLAVMAAYTVQ